MQRIACKAAGGDSCVHFTKLDEGLRSVWHVLWEDWLTLLLGSYNKVFLLRLDNGREVIARVPCPVAGPPRIVTASEVATMQFLRDVLDTPVPRVLSWSADAETSGVGAEYILMDRVAGDSLAKQWPSVTDGGLVAKFLKCFTDLELRWESLSFSQIGSLYFKHDVSTELQQRPLFSKDTVLDDRLRAAADKYRVGPIADRQWWRGERARINFDAGPGELVWRSLAPIRD